MQILGFPTCSHLDLATQLFFFPDLAQEWSARLSDEGHFAVSFASGPYDDLHVLAEGGEKVHETLDGEGAQEWACSYANIVLHSFSRTCHVKLRAWNSRSTFRTM